LRCLFCLRAGAEGARAAATGFPMEEHFHVGITKLVVKPKKFGIGRCCVCTLNSFGFWPLNFGRSSSWRAMHAFSFGHLAVPFGWS
jgi:hypothetical protein